MDHRAQKGNDILLFLGNEIARARGKEQLLRVIRTSLKKYIYFNDSLILRYDQSTRTCVTYIYHFEEGRSKSEHFKIHLERIYPIEDDCIETIPVPVVQDISPINDDSNPGIAFIKQHGILEFVTVKLIEGNELVGFLVLLSDKNGVFSGEILDLLAKISFQVATATANIIANEQLVKKEEEKSMLLSLSIEIASVKNRLELFYLVDKKIKHLFGIEEFALTQIDEHGETYSAFLLDLEPERKKHPDYKKITTARYFVTDPFFSTVMDADQYLIIEPAKLYDQSGMPPYVAYWHSDGVQRLLYLPLRVGGRNVGAAAFHLDKNPSILDHLPLLTGICAQLAVAMSNILAHERIEERKEEKSKLLEFTNIMAQLRDKGILGKVLRHQLRMLFNIDDYAIHSISEDGQTHRPFLFDADAGFAQHPEFTALLNRDSDVNDGVFDKALNTNDLVYFNTAAWVNAPNAPSYANAAQVSEIKTMAGIAIRVGDHPIAVMNFRMDQLAEAGIQQPLFNSICAQLSMIISNLLAREKIQHQLEQIEMYRQQLEEEKTYLQEEIETSQNYADIIGDSVVLKKVFRLVSQVAPSDTTVLLLGETGTGKELIARAIHHSSPRKHKLMIKVNCAALPASLIESELFGHERGSFTGAVERRIGKFELANNGTLFLDEIGEMPLELQAKLLRAIQEKEIERIGGKNTIKTDVRIIAATNRELEKLIDEGGFRADLYYRLNIFPIHLPPLRERKDDIQLLATHFVNRFSKQAGKHIHTFSHKALKALIDYSWPGNIRELEHLVERSVLLTTGTTIRDFHLPEERRVAAAATEDPDFRFQTSDEHEKEYILKILRFVKGKISGKGGAAAILGMPASTLHSKMKKLGIYREYGG